MERKTSQQSLVLPLFNFEARWLIQLFSPYFWSDCLWNIRILFDRVGLQLLLVMQWFTKIKIKIWCSNRMSRKICPVSIFCIRILNNFRLHSNNINKSVGYIFIEIWKFKNSTASQHTVFCLDYYCINNIWGNKYGRQKILIIYR